MRSLEQIRSDIDALDSSLVKLLEKRLALVDEVIAYKSNQGLPVLDLAREEALLAHIAHQVVNKSYEPTLVAIFSDVMTHSKAYQESCLSLPSAD